ncbi:MAG TPA: hypothetical protein VHE57_13285 [Mycobacteriales bacterium]|nr:hypothetical protein [Mycobacteriales bacterium]
MSVVFQRGEVVRVRVEGQLDTVAAGHLSDICREVLRDWPERVELDLSAVTNYTTDGAAAVSDCLMLWRRLNGGVGIKVATQAGRQALLDSMATV